MSSVRPTPRSAIHSTSSRTSTMIVPPRLDGFGPSGPTAQQQPLIIIETRAGKESCCTGPRRFTGPVEGEAVGSAGRPSGPPGRDRSQARPAAPAGRGLAGPTPPPRPGIGGFGPAGSL